MKTPAQVARALLEAQGLGVGHERHAEHLVTAVEAIKADRRQHGIIEQVVEVLEDRGAIAAAHAISTGNFDDRVWDNYIGPMIDEIEEAGVSWNSEIKRGKTEMVDTTALRSGDVIWFSGMRIKLTQREEHPSSVRGLTYPFAVMFHGRVLNAEELSDGGIPTKEARTDVTCSVCKPGEHWVVRGNEKARWSRELR